MQGLEDGIVLTINWDNAAPCGLIRAHDEVPCHDQGFFVGQSHVNSRLHRPDGRQQANRSYHGGHDQLHAVIRCCSAQAGQAAIHFDTQAT
jgi:hypothetical protein